MRQGISGLPLTWMRTGIGLRQFGRKRAACLERTRTYGFILLISIGARKRSLGPGILPSLQVPSLRRLGPPAIIPTVCKSHEPKAYIDSEARMATLEFPAPCRISRHPCVPREALHNSLYCTASWRSFRAGGA